jgi:hypothetical protein
MSEQRPLVTRARLACAAAMGVCAAVASLACSRSDAPSALDENDLRKPDAGRDAARAPLDAGSEASSNADADGPFNPQTADQIGELFGRIIAQRHPPGTTGVKRAVFLKPHGCAKAEFTVAADLPAKYQVGLFATPGRHPAWIRISSDTVPQTPDLENNTIGFAVKVMAVPGRKILAGEEAFNTHDFLLQNHDVFFVDTAQDFLDFTKSAFAGTDAAYLAQHPRTDSILREMAKRVPNVLGTRFWSTTPYRFGANDHAKYTVKPCSDRAPEAAPVDEANYLRKRMERDVRANGACFDFQVQLRAGDMPLDKQTVVWSETVSVPQTVARVIVPMQEVADSDKACENMSFTAWHALPEHRPVGSVNKARGIIYKRMADARRARNGIALTEPE